VRRIVLTGGDHSGKTTLLEALRAEAVANIAVVPEAALQVIEALNRELGVDEQRVWRESHWTEFQARVARRQCDLEDEARDSRADVVVMDRGLPDGIAFCRLACVELPVELQRPRHRYGRYDEVLLLETVTPFAPRSHTGRLGGLERSRALRDLLCRVYEDLGHAPRSLTLQPVEERLATLRALLRA
jgi:predicted ATPase